MELSFVELASARYVPWTDTNTGIASYWCADPEPKRALESLREACPDLDLGGVSLEESVIMIPDAIRERAFSYAKRAGRFDDLARMAYTEHARGVEYERVLSRALHAAVRVPFESDGLVDEISCGSHLTVRSYVRADTAWVLFEESYELQSERMRAYPVRIGHVSLARHSDRVPIGVETFDVSARFRAILSL